MLTQAQLDILTAKYERAFESKKYPDINNKNQLANAYKHEIPGLMGALDDLIGKRKIPANEFTNTSIEKLEECYCKFTDADHALKGCKLPYYLETARHYDAMTWKPEQIKLFSGSYVCFQKAHIESEEVSISKVTIEPKFSNEFLYVTRTFDIPGGDFIKYAGTIIRTDVGHLLTLTNEIQKLPYHCYLRVPFDFTLGFFSGMMLQHSKPKNDVHKTNVVFQKYAHHPDDDPKDKIFKDFKDQITGAPSFQDGFLSFEKLKEHHKVIAKIIEHQGDQLPPVVNDNAKQDGQSEKVEDVI